VHVPYLGVAKELEEVGGLPGVPRAADGTGRAAAKIRFNPAEDAVNVPRHTQPCLSRRYVFKKNKYVFKC
jgi:hypothetical protein